MSELLDRGAAEAMAARAAADWGIDASLGLDGADVPGGWRFRVINPPDATRYGGSDVVVGIDGSVFRVPVGATDDAVARLLAAD